MASTFNFQQNSEFNCQNETSWIYCKGGYSTVPLIVSKSIKYKHCQVFVILRLIHRRMIQTLQRTPILPASTPCFLEHQAVIEGQSFVSLCDIVHFLIKYPLIEKQHIDLSLSDFNLLILLNLIPCKLLVIYIYIFLRIITLLHISSLQYHTKLTFVYFMLAIIHHVTEQNKLHYS